MSDAEIFAKVSDEIEDRIDRFADSCRAVERGEGWEPFGKPSENRAALWVLFAKLVETARAIEREACAEVAEEDGVSCDNLCDTRIAKSIRARVER